MMDYANRLTEELTSVLVPKAALIAYQADGPGNGSYYLEMRRILADGTMGAGMPVPWSFLDEIGKNYVDSTGGTPHGPLPENLRYSDSRRGRLRGRPVRHPLRRPTRCIRRPDRGGC